LPTFGAAVVTVQHLDTKAAGLATKNPVQQNRTGFYVFRSTTGLRQRQIRSGG